MESCSLALDDVRTNTESSRRSRRLILREAILKALTVACKTPVGTLTTEDLICPGLAAQREPSGLVRVSILLGCSVTPEAGGRCCPADEASDRH